MVTYFRVGRKGWRNPRAGQWGWLEGIVFVRIGPGRMTVSSANNPDCSVIFYLLEDELGRGWEAIIAHAGIKKVKVSQGPQEKGRVAWGNIIGGHETIKDMGKGGTHKNLRGRSSGEMEFEQGWRTGEATLLAVYDLFVAMKHRKLLVKQQREKEREESKGNGLLLYNRLGKGEDRKRIPIKS